jgi:hypothetical protein
VGGDQMLASVELWARNALDLPRRPALLFLDPGEGARKPDKDGKLPTAPRTGEPRDYGNSFGQGAQSLLAHYAAFGPHTQAMYEAVWTLDHTERYNFQALVRGFLRFLGGGDSVMTLAVTCLAVVLALSGVLIPHHPIPI